MHTQHTHAARDSRIWKHRYNVNVQVSQCIDQIYISQQVYQSILPMARVANSVTARLEQIKIIELYALVFQTWLHDNRLRQYRPNLQIRIEDRPTFSKSQSTRSPRHFTEPYGLTNKKKMNSDTTTTEIEIYCGAVMVIFSSLRLWPTEWMRVCVCVYGRVSVTVCLRVCLRMGAPYSFAH